jgi:hypothetical protein
MSLLCNSEERASGEAMGLVIPDGAQRRSGNLEIVERDRPMRNCASEVVLPTIPNDGWGRPGMTTVRPLLSQVPAKAQIRPLRQ